jgi:hypothetical protein
MFDAMVFVPPVISAPIAINSPSVQHGLCEEHEAEVLTNTLVNASLQVQHVTGF